MVDETWSVLSNLLGIGEEHPGMLQMGLRAFIIYFAALVMVRAGEKRFMGKNTAFDVILGVILGSVVSRPINSGAELLPTIVAGFVLVTLHWILANIAYRSDRFGNLVKGSTRVLVRDGQVDWDQMRQSHMSKDDLLGALRSNGSVNQWQDVREARLERSGDVSVIKEKRGPEILSATLLDGELVVRIRLE